MPRRPCFGYDRTMKDGPDIALVGSLVGDPARANMLASLMTGRALTATELAQEAGVTPQTASAHLARLVDGGLLAAEKQGRHRYFRPRRPGRGAGARSAHGSCRARRARARAHRAEGPTDAPCARVLRPPRRRPGRQAVRSAAGPQADLRQRRRPRRDRSRGAASSPTSASPSTTSMAAAALSAVPASIGASGAITWVAASARPCSAASSTSKWARRDPPAAPSTSPPAALPPFRPCSDNRRAQ